jgi:Flp pilus assembly protein CpaB
VSVADTGGKEHFARLALGQASPAIGRTVTLTMTPRGAHVGRLARDLGQER